MVLFTSEVMQNILKCNLAKLHGVGIINIYLMWEEDNAPPTANLKHLRNLRSVKMARSTLVRVYLGQSK